MPNYPGSAPSFTAKSPGQTITSQGINDIADEVVAIGTALVTGPLAHGLTINGQIIFPATQNASGNANTLDDYEEGTWTPVIGGSGGTSGQSYTHQVGSYVKIGKLVIATFDVLLSAAGTITTNVQIQGLPFTVENVTNHSPGAVIYWTGLGASFVYITGVGAANTTTLNLLGATAATSGLGNLTSAHIGNTTRLSGTISYRASA